MDVRDGSVGAFPALVAGEAEPGRRPLVVLAGLSPDVGVSSRAMRRTHRATLAPFARAAEAHYVNRRPGIRPGSTMADLASEHADALRTAFDGPVDVAGLSTGGSIAQQLAADHPDVVRRLVLVSTACRLGPVAREEQRRVAEAVRAGRERSAFGQLLGDAVPRGRGRSLAYAAGWLTGPRLFPGPGPLDDLASTVEAEDGFDLARCAPVRAPTLLVGGERDVYYPRALFEETAALIPDCRLDLHPGRGHVSVLGAPGLSRALRTFLAADGPAAG